MAGTLPFGLQLLSLSLSCIVLFHNQDRLPAALSYSAGPSIATPWLWLALVSARIARSLTKQLAMQRCTSGRFCANRMPQMQGSWEVGMFLWETCCAESDPCAIPQRPSAAGQQHLTVHRCLHSERELIRLTVNLHRVIPPLPGFKT